MLICVNNLDLKEYKSFFPIWKCKFTVFSCQNAHTKKYVIPQVLTRFLFLLL